MKDDAIGLGCLFIVIIAAAAYGLAQAIAWISS